jgi:hypothetical protein
MSFPLLAGFESLGCVEHDGSFCVLAASVEGPALGSDDALLCVEFRGHEHRFASVEIDGELSDDGRLQFLLPARLAEEGERFLVERGFERFEVDAPELPAGGGGVDGWIERALLAQQDQILDGARRVQSLRDEVSRQRDRVFAAEEALDEARAQFEATLLASRDETQKWRREAGAERERGEALEVGLAEARAEVAAAEAEVLRGAERVADAEESAGAAAGEVAREREATFAATAEASEARRELAAAHAAERQAEQAAAGLRAELETSRSAAETAEDELARERDVAAAATAEAVEAREQLTVAEDARREAEQTAAALRDELDTSRAAAAAATAEANSARLRLEQELLASAELRRRLRAATAPVVRAPEPVAEVEPEPEPAAFVEPEPEPLAALEAELIATEPSAVAEREPAAEVAPEPAQAPTLPATPGARLIALDMALNGTPRDETADYLASNFELDDMQSLLDEIYVSARA